MLKQKSVLIALSLLFLLGSVIAGCSSDSADGTGAGDGNSGESDKGGGSELSGEVVVWVHPLADPELIQPVREQIEKNFMDQYPDVKLDIQEIPWQNREQKILTALSANQGPDIFYTLPDQTPQFAQQGILEPITNYVEDAVLNEFTEASIDTASYEGELYALPIITTVISPYYNIDLVKEIGEDPNNLPETWAELLEWSEKAKEKGYYGFTFSASNTPNMEFYPWIWQNSGRVIDDEGNITIDSPEVLEAYQFINEAYNMGYIHPDVAGETTQGDEYIAGKTMVQFTSNMFVSNREVEPVDFEWKLGPILKQKEQATYGAVGSLGIASNSKNKEAAVEVLKFLTNEESQRAINEASSYIPTRKSAGDIYDDHEVLSQVVDQVQYIRGGVKDPVARTIIPGVQAEIQAMLAGDKSPEEAVKATEQLIEEERQKLGN